MISMTIDGVTIQTEPTKTIIEAAFEHGIYIPHFCWHPGLSISGNCRLCLVEVEKMPKPVIACSTRCMDGMVVHVNSDKAIQVRNAVMEFILINHPLDCPICDEAGECKLQDYTYKYSVGESRFDEEKNRKHKRVALGPHVVFDGERCISCSRCIRFCEDIVGEPQLTFVERGDRVTIETYPGKELDNAYSMNVVDICPVGALTSKEFRFKSRTWDLSSTPTLCSGCARGCNTESWVRQNHILRLTPRENHDVNGFWMCDEGRLNSFSHVHEDTRLFTPFANRDGVRVDLSWDEALSEAANLLRGLPAQSVAVIGSPYDTCEENWALARFAKEVLNTGLVDLLPSEDPSFADSLLRCADRTPNTKGARLAGILPGAPDQGRDAIMAGLRGGTINLLLVTDTWASRHPGLMEVLEKDIPMIVFASNSSPLTDRASLVLPTATYAEKAGTWLSIEGQLQLLRPSLVTAENERWMGGLAMSRLDKFATPFDRWGVVQKNDVRTHWHILSSLANALGKSWQYSNPEDVFEEMAERIPALHGLTYEKIGRHGCRIEGTVPVHPIPYTYTDVRQ